MQSRSKEEICSKERETQFGKIRRITIKSYATRTYKNLMPTAVILLFSASAHHWLISSSIIKCRKSPVEENNLVLFD